MISLREFDPTMGANHKIDQVGSSIFWVRGERLMPDSDLAICSGVTTEQVLLERAGPANKREVGFHVRAISGHYRVSRKRNIERRTDG
jgi:hypothetical protein